MMPPRLVIYIPDDVRTSGRGDCSTTGAFIIAVWYVGVRDFVGLHALRALCAKEM